MDDISKQPENTLNHQAYTSAFSSDDPLAAFDPAKQAQLKPLLDLYDDPKAEARKQLLSHFLSTRNGMTPELVYENFDHAAQVYNGGETINSEALWQKIKLQFTPAETPKENPNDPYSMLGGKNHFTDIEKQTPQQAYNDAESRTQPGSKPALALESGVYSMLSGMKMLPVLFMDAKKEASKKYVSTPTARRWGDNNLEFWQDKAVMGKYFAPPEKEASPVREYFLEGAQDYAKAAEYNRLQYSNGKGVVDSFREDGATAGAEQLVYAVLENAPQLTAQVIFTMANPFMGPAFMGANAAGSKYGEIIDDEYMSQADKFANVGMTAGAEFFGEYFFSNPLIRRMFSGASKAKVVKGLISGMKRIAVSTGQEAAGEGITQLSENFADMITGKDNFEFKNLKPGEFSKKLLDGVDDAAAIGGVFGGMFGGVGALNNRSYADMDLARSEAKQLTEARKNEILAKKKPSDLEILELDEIEASQDDMLPAPVLDTLMKEYGLDTETRDAIKARRSLQTQTAPNPEAAALNIENAVKESGFAGTVNIVENESDLPKNIKAASQQFENSKIEGVIDADNNIWFVAGNIAPHRAGKVALHEIVGHYGLNGAFGEKLNPLLNQLWNDRAGDIRLMMDNFDYKYDFATEKGKQAAAEEFLARTAESSEKPSWWKEVIAQARTFLRKAMPNMRFTDNDINSLIAKAGKYARQDNSQAGDVRFSLVPDTQEFSSQLDDFVSGNLSPREELRVCGTPDVLQSLGAKALPMTIRQNTVKKITQDKHDISLEQLKQLPEALHRPLMIFDSKTKADSLVILTSLQDDSGKSVVAAVHLNKRMKHHEVNAIASVYGKDNNNVFLTWIKENRLKYINKKRAAKWAQSTGLQLPGEAFPDDSLNNSINDKSGKVKFSLANKQLNNYAAAIAPQVRRKEIASTNDLREIFPELTEGEAENVLIAARDLMKKNDKKRNDELFRQWRSDTFPYLDQLEEDYQNGVKPDAKFGNRENITGTYINWTSGQPSDLAAQALNMDEEFLIESLNGLTKRKIKAEYNKQYSDKTQKRRYEIEALQMRREEVDQLKNDILKGVQSPKIYQLRKFPEMSDFFEELVSGKTKFAGNDVALARIAALSDPAADSAEMLDRYRILRHVQYIKDSGKAHHNTAAAREYIADYARKFMPREDQHRIAKYLKKENITRGDLNKALHEIEAYEMEGSKMQALKKELNSAITQLNKISRRAIRDHYDRLEVAEDLRNIATGLPEDVRKGELNKITNLLAKASTASTQMRGKRRVEIGVNNNGMPVYKQKVDTDGNLRFKDGKPLYEWEDHPDPKSALDRLLDRAFDVVGKAVIRSEKTAAIEDIKKTFDWLKIGKTPKGIPEGKLTPEIQITVDQWRAVNQLLPSQIADLKEALFNTVQNDPDNTNKAEELAALDLFGDLKNKDLEQVKNAQQTLDHLVETGRVLYRDEIMQDKQNREIDRAEWIEHSTGGKWLMDDAAARKAAEKRKKSIIEAIKTFHRGNLSFEWLMNNLSRLDTKSESLKSPLARELSIQVHQATQTESTAIKSKQKDLTVTLEKIFDAKGRGLDRKLSDFKKMQEDTGVFRYPDSNRPTMTMWLIEAEDLVRSLPEDSADRKNLENAVKRAKMDNKRKVEYSEGAAAVLGAGEQVPMSRDEALNFWLIWQQADKRTNMTENNWTPESIEQLEKFLEPEGLALGKHLQELYHTEYYTINDVFKRLFHINMPQIQNYAPAVFDVLGGKDVAMMPDAPEGMSGLNPGSLISRRSHSEKPKQLGASDVYLMHTYQMEHWKAWAGTVKRLRGVFMGKEVRLAIQQYYGKKAYSQILEKINHFADGGNRNATSYSVIDTVRKGFTVKALTGNLGVFVKQLTSLPAYMMDMSISSFAKYSADFWTDPVKNAKFLWNNTDYLKNRWGEGYERDVMRLLRDSAKKRNLLSRGIEAGMIFGKAGDIIPILIGGHAVYQHHYNKMVRDGIHPDAARKEAMLEFEMTTDRTQQAGNMKDLGLYQSGCSIARMFTMFTTSPRQYMQHMTETFGDALAGKKGAKAAAAKKILIAQFILPLLFQAVSDVMRKGFDEEEYDGGDYLRAMVVGPLNGYFIAGGIIEESADALFAGNNFVGGDSAVALSDRKYLNRSLKNLNKTAREGNWTVEDLLKIADQAARGTSAIFAPSAAYSIFRREKKRFSKLFKEKINKYE